MKKNSNNQKSQKDEKILRAKDIFPPFENNPDLHENKTLNQPGKKQIPRMNLAEEIMAEQRKLTSTKRMSPLQKACPSALETDTDYNSTNKQCIVQTQMNNIIKEIVARDIEKICRGKIFIF